MPTYAEIKEQIKALPHRYVFYTRKEIRYLPRIMIDGEIIRALTSGYMGKRTVMAVCTNRRIIFLDKGMFFGMRQWQISLDRVQSIDGNYLIFFGSLRVWDGAAPIKMDMVWARSIDPFIKAVREAIDEFRQIAYQELARTHAAATPAVAYHAPAPAKPVVDIANQLEKLIRLKDAGHLTEEEFQQQRHKLLS
jgi:hypothetical protein